MVTGLRRACFQGLLSLEPARTYLDELLDVLEVVTASAELHRRALEWAGRLGQSRAYDAQYVALAEQAGAELWTETGGWQMACCSERGMGDWVGESSAGSSQLKGYHHMLQQIRPIALTLPFRMGSVNCYLLRGDSGYLLMDCGSSKAAASYSRELERCWLQAAPVRLVVLTHGDFDHSSNTAYFHQAYGAKWPCIATTPAWAGGAICSSTASSPRMIRKLIPFFTGFGKAERFAPDILSRMGIISHLTGSMPASYPSPGIKGSLGILTTAGDLFCGDLLTNTDKPSLNSLIDDPVAAQASLHRLRSMGVGNVSRAWQPVPHDYADLARRLGVDEFRKNDTARTQFGRYSFFRHNLFTRIRGTTFNQGVLVGSLVAGVVSGVFQQRVARAKVVIEDQAEGVERADTRVGLLLRPAAGNKR